MHPEPFMWRRLGSMIQKCYGFPHVLKHEHELYILRATELSHCSSNYGYRMCVLVSPFLLQVVYHDAITKFSLRGAGRPGPRPVSAPLADPTGVAALEHTAAMDAGLRHVTHALLVGVDEKQVMENALQVMLLR